MTKMCTARVAVLRSRLMGTPEIRYRKVKRSTYSPRWPKLEALPTVSWSCPSCAAYPTVVRWLALPWWRNASGIQKGCIAILESCTCFSGIVGHQSVLVILSRSASCDPMLILGESFANNRFKLCDWAFWGQVGWDTQLIIAALLGLKG